MDTTAVYRPLRKIALASSFEGVMNNGALECLLVSVNARQGQDWEMGSPQYSRIIEPAEFNTLATGYVARTFIALRPLVEVAEDYDTVLRLMALEPDFVSQLVGNPLDIAAIAYLTDRFNGIKAATTQERAAFRKAFYDERERLKAADTEAWMNTQSPYPTAVSELRRLAQTMEVESGELVRGFVPWFATSKDEASTYQLCTIYSRTGKMQPGDAGEPAQVCMVTRKRIIGKERTTDKLAQLKEIAAQEEVPHSQVWRLNDRWDKKQQEELWDNGFHYQFIVPGGYVFAPDLDEARQSHFVTVLPENGWSSRLGEYAKEWGF